LTKESKHEVVKPINMILISFLPFGTIYVLRKLGQLQVGLGLFFATSAAVVGVQYMFGFPYGIISAMASLIVTCYIVKYWCDKYNSRVTFEDKK